MKKTSEKLSFLKQFFLHPASVGAMFPAPKSLIKEIMSYIDFGPSKLIIVEYGAGTGAFTERIAKKLKKGDVFIVIESNENFFQILREKFKDNKCVLVYHDGAENICSILQKENIKTVNYIISGVPLSILSKLQIDNLFTNTQLSMDHNSLFIVYQYSILKILALKKYFKITRRKMMYKSLPFYSVFCMKNKFSE